MMASRRAHCDSKLVVAVQMGAHISPGPLFCLSLSPSLYMPLIATVILSALGRKVECKFGRSDRAAIWGPLVSNVIVCEI